MTLKVLVDIVNDITEFIEELERRKEELEELRDELLIYDDEEFIESIKRGLKDLDEGKFKRCGDLNEIKAIFEELYPTRQISSMSFLK
jgi:predicted nuclease with TOPRIM domain